MKAFIRQSIFITIILFLGTAAFAKIHISSTDSTANLCTA